MSQISICSARVSLVSLALGLDAENMECAAHVSTLHFLNQCHQCLFLWLHSCNMLQRFAHLGACSWNCVSVSMCCFHLSPLSRACDICDEVEVFNVGRLRYFKHVIPNVHRKPLFTERSLGSNNSTVIFCFFSSLCRDLLVLTASG